MFSSFGSGRVNHLTHLAINHHETSFSGTSRCGRSSVEKIVVFFLLHCAVDYLAVFIDHEECGVFTQHVVPDKNS
jgi:hypothetical protein